MVTGMATDARIRVEHDDGLAQLTLAHPPVNQFDLEFVRLVRETVEGLPARTRAVVVGSDVPGVFAAGGDIPWMASAPIEEQLVFVRECQDAYSSFERLRCPAIAAIDGHCLGGGLELSLCCDVRVVGESASLGLPETTVGLIAGAGGTQRLVRAVGQGVARDLLLTGRRVTGAEAGALGIASRVVADGTATEVALGIGRQLADGATEAIEATKRLAVRAPDYTLEQGLDAERAEWEAMRRSPKSQEGLDAFAEKRKPDFRSVE
jgi:enoyl-CoA hydratase/carnithine racemase